MINQFKPFTAIRYTSTLSSPAQVLAPPYDVISPSEQSALIASHPNNIVNIDFGPIHSSDGPEENRYTRAREFFTQWLADGILVQDGTPSYYLYEHTYAADGVFKKLRGIFGAAKLYPFEDGVVLPHENTMPGPIQDRLELTKACQANLSPVYTLFDDPDQAFFTLIDRVWTSVPSADLKTNTGDQYRLWKISDSEMISAIYQLFESKKLLIADGHHRYTTALHYKAHCRNGQTAQDPLSDYSLLFATPIQNEGLTIYPTHRVIFDVDGFDPAEFRSQLARYFSIEEVGSVSEFHHAAAQKSVKSIGVAIPGQPKIWLLNLKSDESVEHFFPKEASSVLRGLDVAILQYIILQGILGYTLDDIRQQKGIRYLKSDKAVQDEVGAGSVQAAFVLQATRLEEMRDVCLNGEKMPQKSTYFYPKLITGLVMNPVDARVESVSI